ncbi:hypothetical protein [Taibaiella soli]|uniref:Uncharacterized protein n=1 Tax=Taibaiella soli TaxID=1649169 RepID=A0A2W2B8G8_9BACT|nr:hypothetical protein [Taibaiella soli]PZF72257.1 hypothetical protein DN068_15125 [Taibaiella soli]
MTNYFSGLSSDKKKILLFLAAMFILVKIIIPRLSGYWGHDAKYYRKLLSSRKADFQYIHEIKQKLFKKHDSMASFKVHYTGRALFQESQTIYDAPDINRSGDFLTDYGIKFFQDFMYDEDVYHISMYENREVYRFRGDDHLDITDGTYKDDGIEIAKNIYFHSGWSEQEKEAN